MDAIILGSGPSLPDDMKQVPTGALLISVNGHAACHYTRCDVMAFLDMPEMQMYPDYPIEKYSPWHGHGKDKPQFDGSGVFAAWLGCQRADRVFLCGFDLFERGKHRYFYGGDIINGVSLHKGLAAWKSGWQHLDKEIVVISEALKRHF